MRRVTSSATVCPRWRGSLADLVCQILDVAHTLVAALQPCRAERRERRPVLPIREVNLDCPADEERSTCQRRDQVAYLANSGWRSVIR